MRRFDFIRRVQNEQGVALMMVLIISSVALAVMSALLYMLMIGTGMSGSQRRYEKAVEAADGGKAAVFEWIGQRGAPEGLINTTVNDNLAGTPCMADKLNEGTEQWDPSCDASLELGIGITNAYDIDLNLGDYTIYAKIVNTIEGNSGSGGNNLVKSGVVRSNSGEVPVKPISYLYTIEVETRHETRPDSLAERAKLSILYQY